VEFEQLRHFIKVAELGSFTRAAEVVALSQPALSRSIARLEVELGQPVFDRQTRKVVLTDAGRILLDRAQEILGLADDVRTRICDDGRTGKVRVAAIPTIAPFYLPPILREFGQNFLDAAVIVHEDTTDVLLKKLQNGEVDVAILSRPIDARHLKAEDLFEEELLLVMSADHPLGKKRHIRLADLETLPFVLLSEAHCLSESVVRFCRQQRAFHPLSVETTSQLTSVQELVSLNHGVSLIPAMARALDVSDRRIYRSLSGTKPTRKIVMMWNPYRFQSRLLESFKLQLRKSTSKHHRSSRS
jgi:LysR family hydrogen peroxide-inducible transcriptional activator